MINRILLTIIFLIGLYGCTSVAPGTDSLSQLQNLSASNQAVSGGNISAIRLQALQETAMTVGAQAGLYWRSVQINALLYQDSKTLDRIYNFNGLILPHHVLPPVLLEGRDTLNLNDPDTIRLEDRDYEILSQAKFVTTAPNWRDYLWMNYQKAPIPDNSLLPCKKNEKRVWKDAVAKGWQQGVDQANIIFNENTARLTRDYKGMLLYSTLLAQNIVSPPYVATTNLGVTGGGSSMSVNDQVLRITALPQLRPDAENWKPAITQ